MSNPNLLTEHRGAIAAYTFPPGIISSAITYVENLFQNQEPSHDFAHVCRVLGMTRWLAALYPDADLTMCELTAIAHDIGDSKSLKSGETTEAHLQIFVDEMKLGQREASVLISNVLSISYSRQVRTGKSPETLEAKLVQDADRLDALGATGIARCNMFGATKNRPIYTVDPAHRVRYEEWKCGSKTVVVERSCR